MLTGAARLASADKIRKCSACKAQLSNVFHIPDLWWSEWCRAANGYFGCDDITNDAGEFVGVCKFDECHRPPIW